MAGVVLGRDASCVVVVTQAFSLANWPFGDQEDEGSSPVEHLHGLNVSLVAVLAYAVDKPGHVGESLRADYERLLGVLARLQLHEAVVPAVLLELDALTQSHHLPHVLADERSFRDVLVGYHVVPLPFDHFEQEGTDGEALVEPIGFFLGLAHQIYAEVHAILIEDVLELLHIYKGLRVEHIFVLDGFHQRIRVPL